MTLFEAITGVEQASNSYQSAVTTTQNDQANADAIKVKLDAALSVVVDDKTKQDSAASDFNSSLDSLIAAATAAKV